MLALLRVAAGGCAPSITAAARRGREAARSGHGVIAGGLALRSASQHRRGRHAMDQQRQSEQHYAGLDVSLDATSICVLDAKGAVVWRGKCASTPEAIWDALRQHAPALVRAGLETGQLSNWLTHGLRRLGLPVVCLD